MRHPVPLPVASLPLALLLLSGGGCKGDDDDSAAAPPSEAPPADREDATPAERGDRPLAIDLKLDNLSTLYKGFFRHEPFLERLAADLAPHVRSRSVTIKVVWDDARSSGSIQMLVPDGEETLARVGRGLDADGTVDPAPLDPYLRALDAYRSAVGRRFDMRVLSFAIQLELWDPHSESRCLWPTQAGDAGPVTLGPAVECWEPLGKRFTIERSGDRWPAELSCTPRQRRILAGALGQ